jgi:hypothetical protein
MSVVEAVFKQFGATENKQKLYTKKNCFNFNMFTDLFLTLTLFFANDKDVQQNEKLFHYFTVH